jgi:hypothetical protein
MKTVIRAQSTPWHFGVELFIGDRDGKTRVKEILLERCEEMVTAPPSFNLDRMEAQTLMDDLWNCGIRPTEGTGSAGALRAVERHLADLQKLVFAKDEVSAKQKPAEEWKITPA